MSGWERGGEGGGDGGPSADSRRRKQQGARRRRLAPPRQIPGRALHPASDPLLHTCGCEDRTHVTARSLASAASASSVRRSEPSLSSAKEDPTADAGALSPDLADPPARDREALEAAFFFLASETMVEKKRRGEKEVGRAHKNERRRPWVLFLRVGGWG